MTFIPEFVNPGIGAGGGGSGTFFDDSLSGTVEGELLANAPAADFPTGIILPTLAGQQAYALRLEGMGTVEGDLASDIGNMSLLFGWDSAPTLPEADLGQYVIGNVDEGGLNAIGLDNIKLSAGGEIILSLLNQFSTNKHHFRYKVTVSPAMDFGFTLAGS